jgi:hypothetical protein
MSQMGFDNSNNDLRGTNHPLKLVKFMELVHLWFTT